MTRFFQLRLPTLCLLALGASGCSLIFSGSKYKGSGEGPVDAGSGIDAGTRDAGGSGDDAATPDMDSGVPDTDGGGDAGEIVPTLDGGVDAGADAGTDGGCHTLPGCVRVPEPPTCPLSVDEMSFRDTLFSPTGMGPTGFGIIHPILLGDIGAAQADSLRVAVPSSGMVMARVPDDVVVAYLDGAGGGTVRGYRVFDDAGDPLPGGTRTTSTQFTLAEVARTVVPAMPPGRFLDVDIRTRGTQLYFAALSDLATDRNARIIYFGTYAIGSGSAPRAAVYVAPQDAAMMFWTDLNGIGLVTDARGNMAVQWSARGRLVVNGVFRWNGDPSAMPVRLGPPGATAPAHPFTTDSAPFIMFRAEDTSMPGTPPVDLWAFGGATGPGSTFHTGALTMAGAPVLDMIRLKGSGSGPELFIALWRSDSGIKTQAAPCVADSVGTYTCNVGATAGFSEPLPLLLSAIGIENGAIWSTYEAGPVGAGNRVQLRGGVARFEASGAVGFTPSNPIDITPPGDGVAIDVELESGAVATVDGALARGMAAQVSMVGGPGTRTLWLAGARVCVNPG